MLKLETLENVNWYFGTSCLFLLYSPEGVKQLSKFNEKAVVKCSNKPVKADVDIASGIKNTRRCRVKQTNEILKYANVGYFYEY